MTITVCIPCCNRPAMTGEAVLSAWNQEPKPTEILVGDDSDNDDTRTVIDGLLKRGLPIRYFRNTPSLGQSRNVEHLFSMAEGEIVTLLHDDDRFRPGAFERLIQPIYGHPEVVASFGKQVVISEDGTENIPASERLNADYGRVSAREGILPNSFEAGAIGMFPNNAYLVRKEAIRHVDYHANGSASTACDWYFGFRLGLLGKPFYFVDAYTADYRITRDSIDRRGSDAGFFAFKILTESLHGRAVSPQLGLIIKQRAKMAIAFSARIDKFIGWKWFFSRWHRASILTPGGMRRLLLLLGVLK